MTKIQITPDMFDIAFSLSKLRQGNFTNQFTTKKLKELLSDDPVLAQNVEGVVGYIGDMCAGIMLGLDPHNIMRNMVLDTDLLTHRDECDIVFNGHRIDVKTEFYPPNKFNSVINRTITKNETYGCRLINDKQFRDNSHGIDIYLYGTMDNIDPRKANYWYGIGWISTDRIKEIAPKPSSFSPAGAKLWTPAHCIPNEDLSDINSLISSKKGAYKYYDNHILNPKFSELDTRRLNYIFKNSGL
ncbi:hypothetical protein N9Z00_02440 [Flavobacteriaceae bacterium]|nr:hypothetical protein [Flavobacteriaceae bacterium]